MSLFDNKFWVLHINFFLFVRCSVRMDHRQCLCAVGAFYTHHCWLFIISLDFPIYRCSCYSTFQKKGVPYSHTRLSLSLQTHTHANDVHVLEIPIAMKHHTISMDKIASSYPFMRYFFPSVQSTMEIIYGNIARALLSRVSTTAVYALSNHFKYTLHISHVKAYKVP